MQLASGKAPYLTQRCLYHPWPMGLALGLVLLFLTAPNDIIGGIKWAGIRTGPLGIALSLLLLLENPMCHCLLLPVMLATSTTALLSITENNYCPTSPILQQKSVCISLGERGDGRGKMALRQHQILKICRCTEPIQMPWGLITFSGCRGDNPCTPKRANLKGLPVFYSQ